MASWRPAKSLVVLQKEVNAYDPGRSKISDGMIGDAAHQARKSSHNPDRFGVVRAWDITTASWSDALANHLRILGQHGDNRIWYVIWNRHITEGPHWNWVPYTGSDPHTSHIHLSVSDDPHVYDSTGPWGWYPQQPLTPSTPSQPPEVHPMTGSPRVGICVLTSGQVVVVFQDGGCWIDRVVDGGKTARATAADFSAANVCAAENTRAQDIVAYQNGCLILLENGRIEARFCDDPGNAQ